MDALVTARVRKRYVLGMLSLLGALVLFSNAPQKAEALVTPYCNNQTLGAKQYCDGKPRTLTRVYGWGDQHPVCVLAWGASGMVCSNKAGTGVYSPVWPAGWYTPSIMNGGLSNNVVHGAAIQP